MSLGRQFGIAKNPARYLLDIAFDLFGRADDAIPVHDAAFSDGKTRSSLTLWRRGACYEVTSRTERHFVSICR
ncbi:hypothetical protein PHAMO_270285 [Magnetospirillum molischianum DSM 120]|uniref:Uncharacterized protein n=1 Tax=Magnetospirillum molischianum DSM 120 TaxID=1150626 RepID=H8FSV6_MAGML|nr:hypothetical protein PHAMO_270285 [Magnetospirillum molischianum DSM 120]